MTNPYCGLGVIQVFCNGILTLGTILQALSKCGCVNVALKMHLPKLHVFNCVSLVFEYNCNEKSSMRALIVHYENCKESLPSVFLYGYALTRKETRITQINKLHIAVHKI